MAAFEADCRVEHGTADLSTDIHLDPAGAPRSVNTMRWGNPLGEPFGGYGFGADLDDEATVDGITIPTRICVGLLPRNAALVRGRVLPRPDHRSSIYLNPTPK
jgi:hypothetical protein